MEFEDKSHRPYLQHWEHTIHLLSVKEHLEISNVSAVGMSFSFRSISELGIQPLRYKTLHALLVLLLQRCGR
jgi:hypothetical protein